MNPPFANAYEDPGCARAYAGLDFQGTYYLAFRDLPGLIASHVKGIRALDFGCGAGRSSRFLRDLGYRVTGVDISGEMLLQAWQHDPLGDYRMIEGEELEEVGWESFDLILSAFTFDNIPSEESKIRLLGSFSRILAPDGIFLNLVSSPEIYIHEWASFSTRDFPGNRLAKTGDVVRIVNTSMNDPRPVQDILWPDWDYRRIYHMAGLKILQVHRPLAYDSEPFPWISETIIPPWVIYMLQKSS
jgi:SAM-dependent methyltransferase